MSSAPRESGSPTPSQTAAYARTVTAADGTILPCDRWQKLEDHLAAVAQQARLLGAKLGAADWAWLAGRWHDLGKYHPDFQRMLREVAAGSPKFRVDHSTAGSVHARAIITQAFAAAGLTNTLKHLHLLLTATIAGHHAGLPDGLSELEDRLDNKTGLYQDMLACDPPDAVLNPVRRLPPLPTPLVSRAGGPEGRLRLEFLVRMVLSALVDADRLDAERVQDAEFPRERRAEELRTYASMDQIQTVLDRFIDDMIAHLRPHAMNATERRVYEYRQAVLRACRDAAHWDPGAFSLDVATGGGKTLSSLSFALRHARAYGKDRVIVVIPFTSIIEQTASEYRRALGGLQWNVIEHHSATNEGYEDKDERTRLDALAERRRLATENWDAPVIVTTAVQFFESLLASTPSRCRKLHNIANSVVVIDEAQTLPPNLLNPTVWVINELVEAFGATVVLSTATQPALEAPFPEVRNLRPIIPRTLERPPQRVRVEFSVTEPTPWQTLAKEVAAHDQVLCITHRRRDARELTVQLDVTLGDEGTIHLSANMCPAHRSRRINEIRQRLADRLPCRVVATQLVEAGVDLDFPVVYRSLAGVDSLVQAAGRANREGRLGERGGLMRVYRAPTEPPRGLLRFGLETASSLFSSTSMEDQEFDIFAAETGRTFFREYYGKVGDKDAGITPLREEFRFEAVAAKYRFIPDLEVAVIVLLDDIAGDLLKQIRQLGPSRGRLRRLQRYIVSVFPQGFDALQAAGAVEAVLPTDRDPKSNVHVLRRPELYSDRFGLDLVNIRAPDPGEFVV